jgi:hypothetical protein
VIGTGIQELRDRFAASDRLRDVLDAVTFEKLAREKGIGLLGGFLSSSEPARTGRVELRRPS